MHISTSMSTQGARAQVEEGHDDDWADTDLEGGEARDPDYTSISGEKKDHPKRTAMFEASPRNLPRGTARASSNDSSTIRASKAVQRRVRRSRKSIASKDLLARHQIFQLEARVKILEKRNQGQKIPRSPLLGDLKKAVLNIERRPRKSRKSAKREKS
jgi:hypothetical protein